MFMASSRFHLEHMLQLIAGSDVSNLGSFQILKHRPGSKMSDLELMSVQRAELPS